MVSDLRTSRSISLSEKFQSGDRSARFAGALTSAIGKHQVIFHLFFHENSLTWQFRNQYDSDVTVWSPQGRIHQVEYAMEAVKLGSATVGLKSKDYAVLIALKRATSELSSHQQKILRVDDHIGISMAGITADARILWYAHSNHVEF